MSSSNDSDIEQLINDDHARKQKPQVQQPKELLSMKSMAKEQQTAPTAK